MHWMRLVDLSHRQNNRRNLDPGWKRTTYTWLLLSLPMLCIYSIHNTFLDLHYDYDHLWSTEQVPYWPYCIKRRWVQSRFFRVHRPQSRSFQDLTRLRLVLKHLQIEKSSPSQSKSIKQHEKGYHGYCHCWVFIRFIAIGYRAKATSGLSLLVGNALQMCTLGTSAGIQHGVPCRDATMKYVKHRGSF